MRVLNGLLVVSMIVAGGTPVRAECIVRGSICDEFASATFVFVGEVADAVPEREGGRPSIGSEPPQVARFTNVEGFKGVASNNVTLTFHSGMYQPSFSRGERVLIYASSAGRPDTWFSGCQRTRHVERDDPELAALRSLARREESSVVEGGVSFADPRQAAAARDRSLRDLRITVRSGPNVVATTVTQEYGAFVIAGLRPGRYTIEVAADAFTAPASTVAVGAARCVAAPPLVLTKR